MELAEQLAAGRRVLGIACSPDIDAKLLHYLRLLQKWNRVYNLTAVHDPREMITRHLLDSLAITSYMVGRVVDVGTGAGLPGIPLALVLPQLQFVLVDSNAKKTRFVVQAVTELGLDNVDVVCQRVEEFKPSQAFDTLVVRAFAPITDALAVSSHLCANHGRILIMKGKNPEQELASVPAHYKVMNVHAVRVPGLNAKRHLVVITRQ
ncbi:MAG: 16S rRNA (guanine(527)-N(7))-methyltransferase RsmG [Proteobacteria bacterium]|nr:MAG: 16S rRNA (guanine(527)-N(7))-methyltransferase RsmG [Pseudomonadota bacterium]